MHVNKYNQFSYRSTLPCSKQLRLIENVLAIGLDHLLCNMFCNNETMCSIKMQNHYSILAIRSFLMRLIETFDVLVSSVHQTLPRT